MTLQRRPATPLPAEVSWLLGEGYFGYLGTSDARGLPHVTPVIFVWDGVGIFLTLSKVARKLTNIRENQRVAFLVDIRDPGNLTNNRAVLIKGTARIYGILDVLRRLRRTLRVRSLLLKKYPKYAAFYAIKKNFLPKPWRTTLFISRLLVEIRVERFSYMREAKPMILRK